MSLTESVQEQEAKQWSCRTPEAAFGAGKSAGQGIAFLLEADRA